jgi:hypothetical protein
MLRCGGTGPRGLHEIRMSTAVIKADGKLQKHDFSDESEVLEWFSCN